MSDSFNHQCLFPSLFTADVPSAPHLLLKHGASTTIADYQGEMPLHAAALGGDLYVFRRFLRSAAEDALLTVNNYSETLLHYAAAGGNIGVLRFLLETGVARDMADTGMPTANGWNPVPLRPGPNTHTWPLSAGRPEDPPRCGARDATSPRPWRGRGGRDCRGVVCPTLPNLLRTHAGDVGFSALAEFVRKGPPLGAKAKGLKWSWWSGPLWSCVKGYISFEDGFPWGFRMGVVSEVAPEGVFEAEATTALEWAARFGARAVERVLLERDGPAVS